MKYSDWTKREDEQLLQIVNSNLVRNSQRPIKWRQIKKMDNHSLQSMKSRWAHVLKHSYKYNGKKYVLKPSDHFSDPTVPKIRYKARTPLQNKRVKVSKSFLWGAIKIERYE